MLSMPHPTQKAFSGTVNIPGGKRPQTAFDQMWHSKHSIHNQKFCYIINVWSTQTKTCYASTAYTRQSNLHIHMLQSCQPWQSPANQHPFVLNLLQNCCHSKQQKNLRLLKTVG